MKKINQEVKLVLLKLMSFIAPEGMEPKERKNLAAEAGISSETLRTVLKRQTLQADTLVRLLLARGVAPEAITNLPQTDKTKLSSGEAQWIEFGQELNEVEKTEFVALIKFIRNRWGRLSNR